METDLHISERLRTVLPEHTEEERNGLRNSIMSEGRVRDKILYWYDGERNVIVEGMTRWEIIQGTDIPYDTEEMQFADYDEVELWMLDNQLCRRNVTNPATLRIIRGELYNRLKSKAGGARTPQSDPPKCQIDTLVSSSGGDAAKEVAKKAGVSPATVKRDGAQVEAIHGLTKGAQLVAKSASAAEVKALAKLEPGEQDVVARAIRTGQAKTIKQALKLSGFKAPEPTKRSKPPKKLSRADWYKTWNHSIGPLVRLVDKIADSVGEKHGKRHNAIQADLELATQEMIDWMGVKR